MPVSYQGSKAVIQKPDLPKVREFMTTKLMNLKPEMSVYDAIDLFLKKKISGACVVDDQNYLLGIYSEKDCLKELKNRIYFNQPSGRVKDNMAPHPITVSPDDDLIKVSDIFLYNPFKLIPVVEKKKVVGLISRKDVIRVMKQFREK